MDCRIYVTDLARQDLQQITAWISVRDEQVARRFGNKLIDKAFVLGIFPEMGRVVPELGDPSFREITHGSYRIIYRLFKTKREIHILRFWHAARGTPEISIQL